MKYVFGASRRLLQHCGYRLSTGLVPFLCTGNMYTVCRLTMFAQPLFRSDVTTGEVDLVKHTFIPSPLKLRFGGTVFGSFFLSSLLIFIFFVFGVLRSLPHSVAICSTPKRFITFPHNRYRRLSAAFREKLLSLQVTRPMMLLQECFFYFICRRSSSAASTFLQELVMQFIRTLSHFQTITVAITFHVDPFLVGSMRPINRARDKGRIRIEVIDRHQSD